MWAQAYDNPVPGFETKTVGNLRLFEALPDTELDLEEFNKGEFGKVRPAFRSRRWTRCGKWARMMSARS